MTTIGWVQILIYCAIIVAITPVLGAYMTRVFNGCDNADQSWTPENEAQVTIAKMAKAIVNRWSPQGLDAASFPWDRSDLTPGSDKR